MTPTERKSYNQEYYKKNRESILLKYKQDRVLNKELINNKERQRRKIYRENNKESIRKYFKKYRETNKERIALLNRLQHMKIKYSITQDTFERIYDIQNGKCVICRVSMPITDRRWCIDHDHESSEIRGLLCSSCNKGIGHFRESPRILRSAIQYLMQRRLVDIKSLVESL